MNPAAVLNILIQVQGAQQAAGQINSVNNAAGGAHGKLSKLAKGATLAGAAIGGVLVKGAFDAVSAFEESNKIAKQTDAVLRSTGGAAGVTAKQVSDLATAISKKTGVDDEAIQSGENLLLTFTNLHNRAGKGNDIFNQTTKIMTDMSVALGQDTKSSAIQLGKALNDPVKGVSALQRVGVSFTASQKEQIKTLVKSGKTMDAQKLILKELGKEFGGSAEAQATAGDKLKVTLGNLQETIGGKLAPAFSKAATLLTEFIDGMSSGKGAGGQLVTVTKEIVVAFQSFWDWGSRNKTLLTDIAILAGTAVTAFTAYKIAVGLNAIATAAWAAATTALGTAATVARAPMLALALAFQANPIMLIVTALALLVGGIILAYRHSETFRDIVNGVWTAVKTVAQPVIEWLATALPAAWEAIKTATTAVWDFLLPYLKIAFEIIKTYVVTEFKIYWAIINGVWEAVKAVTTTLWDWFGPYLKGIWDAVKFVVTAVFNAYKTIIVTVWDAIRTVTTTLWAWFGPYLSGVWEAVKTIVTSVFNAYKTIISGVWDAIKTAATVAWAAIKTAIVDPIHEAKKTIGDVWDAIKATADKAWDRIKDGAGTFATSLKNTISDAFRDAANLVVGFVNDIIDVVNKIPGVEIAHVKAVASAASAQGFARGGAFARTGGMVGSPITLMGEEAPRYPEFVIPTNPAYRKRAQGLAMQAAGAVGLAEGGIFGKLGGIAGDLLSKGSGVLLDKLPGTDKLGWLKGLGVDVLRRVTGWIKDKVSDVVGGLLGGIDLPSGFTGGDRIARMVAEMSRIDALHTGYVYGGFSDAGYDCSGLVSRILDAGGFNVGRMTTDGLKGFGESGDGKVITIGVRGSTGRNAHTMMKIGNRYLESGGSNGGAKWVSGWDGVFPIHRHPAGFAQGGVWGKLLSQVFDPRVVGWGLARGGQWGGSFANGGVVPGPAGAPRTIQAHGGEVVLPAGMVVEVYIGGERIDERVDVRIRENGRTLKGSYSAGVR